MLNRRNFLRSSGTGFAGGLIAWSATASPVGWPPDAAEYTPTGMRWTGGGFHAIPAENVLMGDFVVFTPMRRHRPVGPLDLFLCDRAPPGHTRPTVLLPLGRYENQSDVRATLARELREFTQRLLRRA